MVGLFQREACMRIFSVIALLSLERYLGIYTGICVCTSLKFSLRCLLVQLAFLLMNVPHG